MGEFISRPVKKLKQQWHDWAEFTEMGWGEEEHISRLLGNHCLLVRSDPFMSLKG